MNSSSNLTFRMAGAGWVWRAKLTFVITHPRPTQLISFIFRILTKPSTVGLTQSKPRDRGSGVISYRVKITSKSLSFHHIETIIWRSHCYRAMITVQCGHQLSKYIQVYCKILLPITDPSRAIISSSVCVSQH